MEPSLPMRRKRVVRTRKVNAKGQWTTWFSYENNVVLGPERLEIFVNDLFVKSIEYTVRWAE